MSCFSPLSCISCLRPSTSRTCSTTSSNRDTRVVTRDDDYWRSHLTVEQYDVLRTGCAEPRGSSMYAKGHMQPAQGVFRCVACDRPLYLASSMFDAGCGWPAFDSAAYSEEYGCHVGVREKRVTVEVVCNGCQGHLGHVFFGERHTETNERH
eukprot:TRINITY_DN5304_c0_g2_i1.p1 TRINITY_DN5304_c0_g2~~TRINITY_DN5304_c0_g2_i1.p1  ORF type:complete len:152 (-),score=4.05 TRINITY_DN5304_c0_g2_i1:218-673(-)